jgi:hypothetical protein
MHAIFIGMGGGGPIIVTPWSDITFSSPTTSGTSGDRTLSFSGGARNITVNNTAGGTLEYRINSGAYTTYSGAFSVTSGQTLGWRWTYIGNASGEAIISASIGGEFARFNLTATGFGE